MSSNVLSSATPLTSHLPPTSFRGVAIAVTTLQVELVGDGLVVEEVLHHHIMRHRSLVQLIDGNGLVDSQHLAQEGRKTMEQTVRGVSDWNNENASHLK